MDSSWACLNVFIFLFLLSVLPLLFPRSPKALKSSLVPTPGDPHPLGSEVPAQQLDLNSEERAIQLLLGRWVWCTGGFAKLSLSDILKGVSWPFKLPTFLGMWPVTRVQVMEVIDSPALVHDSLDSCRPPGVEVVSQRLTTIFYKRKMMSERLPTIFHKIKLLNSCKCCGLKCYIK